MPKGHASLPSVSTSPLERCYAPSVPLRLREGGKQTPMPLLSAGFRQGALPETSSLDLHLATLRWEVN